MPYPKIHLKEKTPPPNRSIRLKPQPENPGNNPLENAGKIVAPFTSVIGSSINSMRRSSSKIVPTGGKRRRTRQKKNLSKKRRTYRRK